jgi:hypothetical protein
MENQDKLLSHYDENKTTSDKEITEKKTNIKTLKI